MIQPDQVGRESRTLDQVDGLILNPGVWDPVSILNGEINGFQGQIGMEFPRLPFVVDTVPVINPVRCIGSLLDFGQQDPRTECVNPAGWYEEYISTLDGLHIQDLLEPLLLQEIQVHFLIDGLAESADQLSLFIRIQHVPHLRFSVAYIPFGSKSIIRMYLDRKPVVGVNKLDKDRELTGELLKRLLSYKIVHVNLDQIIQFVPFQEAVGNYSLASGYSRQNPRLPAVWKRREVKPQFGADLLTAPHFVLKNRSKLQWIKCVHNRCDGFPDLLLFLQPDRRTKICFSNLFQMTSLHTICLFCGSAAGSNPVYREAGLKLAAVLIERKMTLVYGGANVGLMKVVADAMLKAGGSVIGVMPKSLADREVAHDRLTAMHIVPGMQERKALMAGLSDGFITMPGGYGTFDEIFEMLSWSQLKIMRKSVGILNINGYFDPLMEQLDRAVMEGFLRAEHRELLLSDTEPERLIDRMEKFVPVEAEKWIDRLKSGTI